MIADIGTALISLVEGIGDFLTPTASEASGALLTATAVAGIATLFAVPATIAIGKKAIGLVKSIKG